MSRNRNRNRYFGGPPRYICTVLEEMRTCNETRNYSILLSLIEEAQTLSNRMEAALDSQKTIKEMEEYRRTLKKEIRELESKADKLEEDCQNNIKEKD